jgi:hypothetical protein
MTTFVSARLFKIRQSYSSECTLIFLELTKVISVSQFKRVRNRDKNEAGEEERE